VRSTSTIEVRSITYSVPSRLIGQQLTVHLRHDRLDLFLRSQFIEMLPRLHRRHDHKGPLRRIDFRHVIESLRRNPRGLLRAQLQAEILPGVVWEQLWRRLLAGLPPDEAAKFIVDALHIAAKQGSSSCSASSSYGQAYPVITITWNFINPSRYPQIAGAQKSIKLAQSQANQSSQQLQLAVLKSYGTYLLSGYQLGELSRLIALEQTQLSTTNLLVQQRGLPRYARSQEARNLLSYQARLQQGIAIQQQAYLELSASMQKASAEAPSILPDLNSLVLRDWAYDEQQSIKMAMKYSEQLKQLVLQKGIATDSANQTRGQILPTIGVLGYVTYQGTDDAGTHSGLLSNYIGLSVNWNLFDGYSTKNQAISSDRQASSYAVQHDAAKSQLKLLIKSKLLNLSSLKNQINLYLNDIRHTELIASDLRARQRFGINGQADVLQAEQAMHESRLQLINTIGSYVVTYTELANLCGVDPLG